MDAAHCVALALVVLEVAVKVLEELRRWDWYEP